MSKFLIQDGTDLKYINGSNLSIACNTTDSDTVKESAFLTYGMNDVNELTYKYHTTKTATDKGTLGSGKYFEITLTDDFEKVNSVTIS